MATIALIKTIEDFFSSFSFTPLPVSEIEISIYFCKRPELFGLLPVFTSMQMTPFSGVYLKAFESRLTSTLSKLFGSIHTVGSFSGNFVSKLIFSGVPAL